MKTKSVCVSIGILLVAGSVTAHAAQFGDFGYESSGSTITITGYTGPGGAVHIPGVIAGLPVTDIGMAAFKGCTSLTSVMIPNSVTSIAGGWAIGGPFGAFTGCSGLTNVTIPNSVTSIGAHAFSGCTSLTSVTIPNSVTSIESEAFYGCTSLTSVTIPNGVTSIGSGAFCGCTSLTSLTIPNSVTSVEGGAFCGCTSLTSVEIPDSVTSIEWTVFSGCTSLTNVTIGNGVTSVGENAFYGCTSLRAIDVAPSNPALSSLEGVLFNETRTTLLVFPGGKAGAYVVPDGVTSIGDFAFQDRTSLTSVTIPNSVSSIGWLTFGGCTSLTSLTIPSSVTSIGLEAFRDCASLTSVTIGNGVTSIGGYAFYSCSSLTSVAIPDSVISIGREAFGECTRLTSVTIGDGVSSIGVHAFSGCTRLTSVTMGDGVTSIGYWAFSGCTSLTSLYFHGDVPDTEGGVFEGSPAAIIYYRAGTAGWRTTFAGRPTALWIEPPVYSDWLPSTGLLTQYPNASAEADDPDQDGLSNYAEMLAGTDPTDAASLLTLERVPRPNDLTEADRAPIGASQHAVYFRSVPGKRYSVQWSENVDGPWHTDRLATASTTQTRWVFDQPATQAFYRVVLAQ